MSNMASSLILHKRIETTVAKAKGLTAETVEAIQAQVLGIAA